MRGLQCAAALVLLIGVALGAPSYTILIDDSNDRYLQPSSSAFVVPVSTLGGIISALTGLMPSSEVDSQTVSRYSSSGRENYSQPHSMISFKVERVVKPSPLKKPRAHAVFNVAGLSQGKSFPDVTGSVREEFY